MKRIYIYILLLIIVWNVQAQSDMRNGYVSFISSQNVYVRFENTLGINIADTLYQQKENKLLPSAVVQNFSSISCVCTPLNKIILNKDTELFAKIAIVQKSEQIIDNKKTSIDVNETAVENATRQVITKEKSNLVNGRISVNSYSTYDSNGADKFSQRFRYNLTLNVNKIANTALSFESNLAFSHKIGVNSLLNESLKIYGAAVNYDLSDKTRISLGRKINSSMANIGAIDGLQLEHHGNKISYGAIVGSRPDYSNYSFSPTLFQYGAYIGHKYNSGRKYAQTSFAVFNQTNNFVTDRRFAYLQHSNSIVRQLDFFGSIEFDLYNKTNNVISTRPQFTSTYLSLRYRLFKDLSMSIIYDARRNIFYYETFKNIPDSIFDKETRQGFKLQVNYKPFKFLSLAGNAGYRMPTTNSSESMHGNASLMVTQIPVIKTMFTADAAFLKTPYVNGAMYSGTLTREFLNAKLSTDLTYRYINYQYPTQGFFKQHIAEISLVYRLSKKLFVSGNIEGNIDFNNNSGTRLFINLTQRF